MAVTEDSADDITAEEEPPLLAPRARKVAFGLIASGMLLAALDSTIVATALPTIAGDLGGATHLSWVVTAYLLTQTIATAIGGKFGDIFGRKKIFVGSIVLFTAASALAGLADSMTWLIASRALQGIGGGGLTVTATAMIADIIPLRERGKYQGAIGAVFGVTTVLGPLLGGFFTDNLSWRWVFYVNVPIALIIIPFALRILPSVKSAGRPVIDYLGVVLVSAGASGLILATSWGGTEYAWGSSTIIGLFIVSVIVIIGFLFAERRAEQPILPLRLFRSNVFATSTVLSFIVGFALMGCLTFLPTYLQYGQGVSATSSGIRMLPMVVGLMIASISAGTVVGRTGKYKAFPIAGAVVMGMGMYLLSRLDEHSSTWTISGSLLVLGAGIGLAMQVLTIIVQNTAAYRDLGVATSGVTFFRAMGQSFGAAVFGTIYANKLKTNLAEALAVSRADPTKVTTPEGVRSLPSAQHAEIVHAYTQSLQSVFLLAAPVAVVAFAVALFLKQVPMRGLAQSTAAEVGPGFGMPDERSTEQRLESQAIRLLRTRLPEVGERLIDGSDTGLDAVQVWVLRQVAIGQHHARGFAEPKNIARRHRLPLGVIQPALDDAAAAGLIESHPEGLVLTEAGFNGFRAVSRQLWLWLLEEFQSDGPMDDDCQAQLRVVARRLVLDERALDQQRPRHSAALTTDRA